MARRADSDPGPSTFAVALPFAAVVAIVAAIGVWHEEALPGYTLDSGGWLLWVILAVTALLLVSMGAAGGRASRGVLWAVGGAPFAALLVFFGAHLINRFADSAPAVNETVIVTAVSESNSHTDLPTSFVRGGRTQTINLYRPPEVGRPLKLRVHPGRLGWQWAEVDRSRR